MAQQQEEGWPLGLQPLNVRIGLARNPNYSESISYGTLLSGSPTSFSDSSSSDLDTESTGSFFHDKSVTLGSLIGVSTILERSRRSRRSTRERRRQEGLRSSNCKKTHKASRAWFFSLCPKDTTDAEIMTSGGGGNPSSLAHLLAAERRAGAAADADDYYGGADEFAVGIAEHNTNSLFVGGCVAPPRPSPWVDSGQSDRSREDSGAWLLLSCVCAQSGP